MAAEVDRRVAAGREAMLAGDWSAARREFEAAVAVEEVPEALSGLGEALWWLGESREGLAWRERAYGEFRRRGPVNEAVDVALWLAKNQAATLGNAAAAGGWLARARRLVDEHGLAEWDGWVLIMEAHHLDDPAGAEELARRAHRMASERADADLELCALGAVGSALVAQGRVQEGVRLLDESMAGALGGEGRHRDTVVFTSCTTIISCSWCAEFERAVQWIHAADRFTAQFGCPFLHTQCRTVYGAVLMAIGDWDAAERELMAALDASEGALPALRGEALAVLGELRLAQGRIEEAERLVEGLHDQPGAAAAVAEIHLRRGRASTAEALLRRWVPGVDGPLNVETLKRSALLGEAELALGRPTSALERGKAMAESGRATGCRLGIAHGARLWASASVADGDSGARGDSGEGPDDPGRLFAEALESFGRLGVPLEAGRTRLALARWSSQVSTDVAIDEATVALRTFEALGAALDADAAAGLLRDLGARSVRGSGSNHGTLTHREREVLGLLTEGLSNAEIADRLYIGRRTVEQHVARILRKLRVRSRTEAAAVALRDAGGRAP